MRNSKELFLDLFFVITPGLLLFSKTHLILVYLKSAGYRAMFRLLSYLMFLT